MVDENKSPVLIWEKPGFWERKGREGLLKTANEKTIGKFRTKEFGPHTEPDAVDLETFNEVLWLEKTNVDTILTSDIHETGYSNIEIFDENMNKIAHVSGKSSFGRSMTLHIDSKSFDKVSLLGFFICLSYMQTVNRIIFKKIF